MILALLVILMILSLYIIGQVVKSCLQKGKANAQNITAIISSVAVLFTSGILFYIN